MAHTRSYLGCLASLALMMFFFAACSGGGGGPSAAPAPASAPAPVVPVAAPNGGPVSFQPANMTVTYPAAASVGTVANGQRGLSSSAASDQGATVKLTTDTNGNLTKVAFNIPATGFTQPFDANSGSSSLTSPLSPATFLSLFGTNNFGFLNNTTYLATQSTGTQLLNTSAYGLWGNADGFSSSRFGGFAIGSLTPSAAMPATGSATFNGSTIGVGGSDAYTFMGSAQIIANFSANTATTNFTNITTTDVSGKAQSLPNLTGTSSISGNAYAGSISGTGLTGTVNGNFYGSAAQETAGVWQASNGGSILIGSYGAK
jgi:hypothetical protein